MAAIHARGLVRTFGEVRAVDGLDLDVKEGQVFGYLGPNGAGKTTTLHLLLGLMSPDAGRAEVFGMDVATEGGRVRRRCGVLLEHDGLYERLSARDNLVYHARIFGVPPSIARRRADDLLAGAGWSDRADHAVGDFSRGMKRRLGVLRTFMTEPDLVFLDEPTSGFDPRVAADLRDFLRTITREQGTTVFLTTHNMQEAEAMCDEVAVLSEGRVIATGRPGALRDRSPQLRVTGEGFGRKVLAALRRRKDVVGVDVADGGVLLHLAADGPAAPIVSSLVRQGVAIEGVERVRSSLEEDFLALMEVA